MNYLSVVSKLLILLFILPSCEKPEEKKPYCTTTFYKGFYVSNYSFFKLYSDVTVDGVHQTTKYTQGDGSTFSRYSTEMTIDNLCTRQDPIIEFEIWMKNEVFSEKSAYIEESGVTGRTNLELLPSSSPKFYVANTSHTFQDASGKTAGTLLLHLDFSFPYQGNTSADSLYFFSNMKQLKTGITFSYKGK